jgi:hypothetical protein
VTKASLSADAGTTLKLPVGYTRRTDTPTIDDSNKAFVTGSSAISYEQLATDTPPEPKRSSLTLILVILIVLVIAGVAAYFFFFLKR